METKIEKKENVNTNVKLQSEKTINLQKSIELIQDDLSNIIELSPEIKADIGFALIDIIEKYPDVDKQSVIVAIKKMVLAGVRYSQTQCYFVKYGNKIKMMMSYFGLMFIAKKKGLKDITARVIREGDTVELDIVNGKIEIKKHITSFENWNNHIKGVYVIAEMENGAKYTDLMTIEQVNKVWMLRAVKEGMGLTMAHKNFPDQMAIKSCIARVLKSIINSDIATSLVDDEETIIEADNNDKTDNTTIINIPSFDNNVTTNVNDVTTNTDNVINDDVIADVNDNTTNNTKSKKQKTKQAEQKEINNSDIYDIFD